MPPPGADPGYLAWGRVHRSRHRVVRPRFAEEAARAGGDAPNGVARLAYGRGRSYGDVCLNDGGTLIDMSGLDRVVAFDPATGRLTCEAGLILRDILADLVRPAEGGGWWFPPVLPGTKFVTVGGAIANDVHGKNHHDAGSFGDHVLALDLVRSSGETLTCSPRENARLFRATIGGMGLTGLIVRATLQLARVPGLLLDVEDIRMDDLDAFYALDAESKAAWPYTVAWVDCLARGRRLGRGVFTRARPIAHGPLPESAARLGEPKLAVPVTPPVSPLNRVTLAAFNAAYARRLMGRRSVRRVRPYDPVFFPLDGIGGWNRLYGKAGFFQYQCVVPPAEAPAALRALLDEVARARQGSFLAVLKTFGDRPAPGLMSFARPGTTLALDFPNRGAATRALLDRLDAVVVEAGGRIYPAKDGRVAADAFRRFFPEWEAFAAHVDPGFSSDFWRRVTGGAGSA
ncbi:MAG: FAD-binding oxidoreductase [Azospirillaceae bacterium]